MAHNPKSTKRGEAWPIEVHLSQTEMQRKNERRRERRKNAEKEEA